jgi:hypothetical protein
VVLRLQTLATSRARRQTLELARIPLEVVVAPLLRTVLPQAPQ